MKINSSTQLAVPNENKVAFFSSAAGGRGDGVGHGGGETEAGQQSEGHERQTAGTMSLSFRFYSDIQKMSLMDQFLLDCASPGDRSEH